MKVNNLRLQKHIASYSEMPGGADLDDETLCASDCAALLLNRGNGRE